MGNKQTIDEDINTLSDSLKKLRDARNDRIEYSEEVLKSLNYKKERKPYEFDAFLVKAIVIKFQESMNADIALMAFGLMQGYEYEKIATTDRRYKFLEESDYLAYNPRSKIKTFTDATEDEKYHLAENLRSGPEDKRIEWLADFLLSQSSIEKFIEEIDNYIKTVGEKQFAKLPEPSYLKNNRSIQNEPTNGDNTEHVLDADNVLLVNSNQKSESTILEKFSLESIISESGSIDNPINGDDAEQEENVQKNSIDKEISVDKDTNYSWKKKLRGIAVLISNINKSYIKIHLNIRKSTLIFLLLGGLVITFIFLLCTVYNYLVPKVYGALEVEEIRIKNKYLYLEPGEDTWLDIAIEPDSVQEKDLDYTSSDRSVVKTEKHHIIAQKGWQEDAKHDIIITVQGGDLAEDKAYITVIAPRSINNKEEGVGYGPNDDVFFDTD